MEGKKPKIHLTHEPPRSPYVIHLTRPTSLPSKKKIRTETSNDLKPTAKDVASQIHEDRGQQKKPIPNHPPVMAQLLEEPVHDYFAKQQQHTVEQAFQALELPEFDPPKRQLPTAIWLPHGWQKALGAFVLLSFAVVLPIHAMQEVGQAVQSRSTIEASGLQAVDHLRLAGTAIAQQEFAVAHEDFLQASQSFADAQESFTDLSAAIQLFLQTTKPYTSAKGLVRAGEELATSAALLSEGFQQIESSVSSSPVTNLSVLARYLERLQPHLNRANEALASVVITSLPEEYQSQVQQLQTELPRFIATVDELLRLQPMLHTLLGGNGPMRYLLVFQNNTELRPSGGFMGSFAEITMEHGAITSLHVPKGGSYDLQGSLQEFVEAPEPLQLLKSRWEFQDSNWFADFPTTAEKLIWFYDNAGGPTVDGVLAVNATELSSLLSILGPITLPDYQRTFTADNVLLETQTIVEKESDPELHQEKALIGDLANALLEKSSTLDGTAYLQLVQSVSKAFGQKELQLYLTNPTWQQEVTDLGWAGAISTTDDDYVMLVNTNLGGGKTDLAIDEQVMMDVEIMEDGSMIHTATITRRHMGTKDELFIGVNNVNYLRLYVPEGSELLSASGDFAKPDDTLFEAPDLLLEQDPLLAKQAASVTVDPKSGTETMEEFGKTVFANWTQTKPGATSVVQFRYRTPYRLSVEASPENLWQTISQFFVPDNRISYRLTLQKQSGALRRQTRVRLHQPPTWKTLYATDDQAGSDQSILFTADTDHFFAALFTPVR